MAISKSLWAETSRERRTEMDPEVRRKRLTTMVKWGIGVAGAAIISPILYFALKGLLGLAALVVAGAIGYVVIELAPVFAMKIANWKVKMIVSEAEKNPIETMENLRIEKAEELARADQGIVDFETEIGNYDDQLEGFKHDYPTEAPTYVMLSEKMHDGLLDMKREQSTARHELANFEQQIKKAKAIYKMALAAQRVTQLSKSAEAQVFAKIREEVAFDSVRTQLNRAFANLNLALEKRVDARPALPEGRPVKVIDATPTTPERVPVPRNPRKEG